MAPAWAARVNRRRAAARSRTGHDPVSPPCLRPRARPANRDAAAALGRHGGSHPRDAPDRRHPMARSRRRWAEALIGRIEATDALDPPGYAIGNALARPAQIIGRPARRLGNALHGTGYGHPVHPMLVTLPIGSWTLALGLDLLAALGLVRDRRAAEVADTALRAGALGAVAAAATGMAAWQYTDGRDRRLGLVHALAN